jgi:hypothetical protein
MLFTGWAFNKAVQNSYESMSNQDASSKASHALGEVEAIKNDIERLLMITEALWIILKDVHGYTDEMLVQKINEVDLQDGRLDGRVAQSPPEECPQCHRKVVSRKNRCLFCGEQIVRGPFTR